MDATWLTHPAVWSFGIAALAYLGFVLQLSARWRGDGHSSLLMGFVVLSAFWAVTGALFVAVPTPAMWFSERLFDALRMLSALAFLCVRARPGPRRRRLEGALYGPRTSRRGGGGPLHCRVRARRAAARRADPAGLVGGCLRAADRDGRARPGAVRAGVPAHRRATEVEHASAGARVRRHLPVRPGPVLGRTAFQRNRPVTVVRARCRPCDGDPAARDRRDAEPGLEVRHRAVARRARRLDGPARVRGLSHRRGAARLRGALYRRQLGRRACNGGRLRRRVVPGAGDALRDLPGEGARGDREELPRVSLRLPRGVAEVHSDAVAAVSGRVAHRRVRARTGVAGREPRRRAVAPARRRDLRAARACRHESGRTRTRHGR